MGTVEAILTAAVEEAVALIRTMGSKRGPVAAASCMRSAVMVAAMVEVRTSARA